MWIVVIILLVATGVVYIAAGARSYWAIQVCANLYGLCDVPHWLAIVTGIVFVIALLIKI